MISVAVMVPNGLQTRILWSPPLFQRPQVAREREAERRAQRAQRAVDAARRSRLAREAAFEVWEDVDNYEEPGPIYIEGSQKQFETIVITCECSKGLA